MDGIGNDNAVTGGWGCRFPRRHFDVPAGRRHQSTRAHLCSPWKAAGSHDTSAPWETGNLYKPQEAREENDSRTSISFSDDIY